MLFIAVAPGWPMCATLKAYCYKVCGTTTTPALLQTMHNKCLRMALNKPYYIKITELHDIAGIPTVDEFFRKNAENFYE